MLRLYRGLKCALHMARADDEAASGRYDKAMHQLSRCYELFDARTMPSSDVPPTLNLRAAFFSFRLGEHQNALMGASLVVSELRAMRGRYNAAERAHLDQYARMLGSRAAYEQGVGAPWPLSSADYPTPQGKIRLTIQSRFRPALIG